MRPALLISILVFTGCASRINALESAISREARARWTMKQIRALNESTKGLYIHNP